MSATRDVGAEVVEAPLQSREFFERLRFSFPFASNRVSSLDDADVHVRSIHEQALAQLRQVAQEARCSERGGQGVVVWGDPGVGKSHLLARFLREVSAEGNAVFVFLHNLLAPPQLLPQYLLKCLISRMVQSWPSDARRPRLYDLTSFAVTTAIRQNGEQVESTRSVLTAKRHFTVWYDQVVRPRLPESVQPDSREVGQVLFTYFAATHLRRHGATGEARGLLREEAGAALRWLSGEDLDADDLQRLGLPATRPSDATLALPNDQRLEAVLLVLAELARLRGVLLVLCFDQVENFSDERFTALFRFNHAVLDHGRNLLLVTSGVRGEMVDILQRKLVPQAAWDRLAHTRVELYFISPVQARQLLQQRLEPFLEPFLILPRVKEQLHRDGLFPLGERWWEQRVAGNPEVRPRDVISWANLRWREQLERLATWGEAAWWDRWQDVSGESSPPGPARSWDELVDEKVDQKLQEQRSRRKIDASLLPPSADHLRELLRAVWARCRQRSAIYGLAEAEPVRQPAGTSPTYDLVIGRHGSQGQLHRTGIKVVVTENATSATAMFRRLVEDPSPPDLMVVLEDARQPIRVGDRGLEYRQELERRGPSRFRVVSLSFEDYVWLEALHAVIDDAHSGDLEIDVPGSAPRRVTREEVEGSHHRRDRYRQHPLLKALLVEEPATNSPETPPARAAGPIDELRGFILGELQLISGVSSRELAVKLSTRSIWRTQYDFDVLKGLVEEAARHLHREEKLQATPVDDDLYLLLRP